jgi:uncharacterized membrane protein
MWCILYYGLWGFLSKFAQVQGVPSAQESLIQKIGVFTSLPIIAQLTASASGPQAGPSPSLLSLPIIGLLSSFSSGFSSGIASLFYSRAMAVGDASTVSAVTACYPPVTMVLGAMFLGEKITQNKLIGMLFLCCGLSFTHSSFNTYQECFSPSLARTSSRDHKYACACGVYETRNGIRPTGSSSSRRWFASRGARATGGSTPPPLRPI